MLLFPATYDGRDIAGRLSAKTDLPLLTNVVELNNDTLETRHLLFGGSQVATARFTSPGPHLFVVRAKSFQAESRRFGDAEVIKAPVPDMGSTNSASIIERHIESATGPELEDARVIVSGGRGLGSAENYKLIEELARLLNGAAGATRAIVDAGWVPYSYQVGQTGKTVRPDVYIACGISGATQHLVGMKNANAIIAVNRDPDAAIFSIADLSIVGDVMNILPEVIDTLRAKQAQ